VTTDLIVGIVAVVTAVSTAVVFVWCSVEAVVLCRQRQDAQHKAQPWSVRLTCFLVLLTVLIGDASQLSNAIWFLLSQSLDSRSWQLPFALIFLHPAAAVAAGVVAMGLGMRQALCTTAGVERRAAGMFKFAFATHQNLHKVVLEALWVVAVALCTPLVLIVQGTLFTSQLMVFEQVASRWVRVVGEAYAFTGGWGRHASAVRLPWVDVRIWNTARLVEVALKSVPFTIVQTVEMAAAIRRGDPISVISIVALTLQWYMLANHAYFYVYRIGVLGVPLLYADPTVNAGEVLDARQRGVDVRQLVESGHSRHATWVGSMRQLSSLVLNMGSVRPERTPSMRHAPHTSTTVAPPAVVELVPADGTAGRDDGASAANPMASRRVSQRFRPAPAAASWTRVPLYDYAVVGGLLLADPRSVHHFIHHPPPPIPHGAASAFVLQPMPTGAWTAPPAGARASDPDDVTAAAEAADPIAVSTHLPSRLALSGAFAASTSAGRDASDRAASAGDVQPKMAPPGSASPAGLPGGRVAGRTVVGNSPGQSSVWLLGSSATAAGGLPNTLSTPSSSPSAAILPVLANGGGATSTVAAAAGGGVGALQLPALHIAASEPAMDPGAVLTGRGLHGGNEDGNV